MRVPRKEMESSKTYYITPSKIALFPKAPLVLEDFFCFLLIDLFIFFFFSKKIYDDFSLESSNIHMKCQALFFQEKT